MTTPLEIALDYIDRRWSPIPIPYGFKRPVLAGWPMLRITAQNARQYFNGEAQNIGVQLGEPSGWLVDIDLDCPEAVRAAPYFLPHRTARYGHEPSNPVSHWLYVAEGLATKQFVDPDEAKILEIRSTGAQSLFPGSSWRPKDRISRPVSDQDVFEPYGWTDEVRTPQKIDAEALSAAVVKVACAALLGRHFPKEEGKRHSAALVLGGFLLRCGWSAADIGLFTEAVVVVAGLQNRLAEFRRTAAGAVEAGEAGKKLAGRPRLKEIFGDKPAEKVAAWLGYRGEDAREPYWPADMDEKRSLPHMAAYEAGDVCVCHAIVSLAGLNPVGWKDTSPPPRKWRVPDYIPHRTVTLFSGDGGLGKSLLGLQLAAAMALGRDWIGLLPEPGRVLVVSAEDDADEMHRRLDDIRKFHGAAWADLADIRLVDLVGEDSILGQLVKGRIEPTAVFAALEGSVFLFRPDLVILDVLAAMFAGQENDRSQVRQFVNLLKGLAKKHDCAILLLAHPSVAGMNAGTGSSGSTDWNNAVRRRIYLETPKDAANKNLRTFRGMKNNYGERGGAFDIEWRSGVFIRINGPSGFDKLAIEAKADDVFLKLLTQFSREGRDVSPNKSPSFAPAVFARHPDAGGLPSNALSAAMDRLLKAGKVKIQTSGPPSRRMTRLILGEEIGDALGEECGDA